MPRPNQIDTDAAAIESTKTKIKKDRLSKLYPSSIDPEDKDPGVLTKKPSK